MDESKKILVVEDDDHVRLLLIEYLEEHAHLSVEGARDGAEALHHVATGQYALVILDLMMPFMTGIDFLDSLEAMISDPSIKPIASRPPVIVITSAPLFRRLRDRRDVRPGHDRRRPDRRG